MNEFNISEIREQFPILSQKVHGKPLVYLDSGATAQKPLCVIEKINELHRTKNANVHRGVHSLSEQVTVEYEAAREVVRGFINAESTAEIIFTSGATAAINTVAYSFGERFIAAGDNVIVSEMEHHSNIVPWQLVCERKGAEIRVLPFDDDGRLQIEMLRELIDERTRIVAVTQASNVLGTRPAMDHIISVAHSLGVAVLVDGCQGVVHNVVDVRQMDCDFYAFSGHKLYGPTGIGVLYGKRALMEQLPPFLGGGDMVGTVSFSGTTYADLPLRFEAGTSNYIGAIAMAEGMRFVDSINRCALECYERQLLEYATQKLQSIDGLRIYGTQGDKCSIVSFTVEGTHPYDIGMIVDKLGVAIRTGTHCAEPVMAHYGLTGMCRASFAMYNTIDEIDILVSAVSRAVSMLR